MNRLCMGAILLVGEGDFSLSVALRKQLPHVSMVTSSLLSEHDIKSLHQQAAHNIISLQRSDVLVLLNTDATTLQTNSQLCGWKFARIVFNFPHVGGKSNIKKNRELLKNFFLSAVHLLTDGGELMVTLCNGQGGTTADKPQRTWHNCWQVVSMATYANLILSEDISFQAADYPEYSCSGFRSQDKHFNTEGAVTHVFVKAEPIPDFSADAELITLSGVQCYCSSYVARKINRSLLRTSGHPVCLTSRFIEAELQQHLQVCVLDPSTFSAATCTQDSEQMDEHLLGDNHSASRYEVQICQKPAGNSLMSSATENTNQYDANSQLHADASIPTYDTRKFALRRSLFDQLPSIMNHMTGESLSLISGEVYSRIPIVAGRPSVCHEMLGLLPASVSEQSDFLQHLINVLNHFIKQRVECTVGVPNSPYSPLFSEDCPHGPYTIYIQKDESSDPSYIGMYGKLKQACTSHINKQDGITVTAFVLNLDLVASAAFSLPDVRLLWSESVCSQGMISNVNADNLTEQLTHQAKHSESHIVLNHHTGRYCSNSVTDQHIEHHHSNSCNNYQKKYFHKSETDQCVYSMYPSIWEHHISFWIRDEKEFDEQKFFDIIRDMADDLVKSVTLKESFVCPDSGRISYCYQELFQSCDKALSYHKSHDLQKNIRLKIADVLNIELR